jgi:hypothetical protein
MGVDRSSPRDGTMKIDIAEVPQPAGNGTLLGLAGGVRRLTIRTRKSPRRAAAAVGLAVKIRHFRAPARTAVLAAFTPPPI